ncbi:hypothetical protein [Streptomyces roseolus]|nr:hypothetical protein [Streptomyces roseolus]
MRRPPHRCGHGGPAPEPGAGAQGAVRHHEVEKPFDAKSAR